MVFMPGQRTLLSDTRRLAAALATAMAAIHNVTSPAIEGLPDETAAILLESDNEAPIIREARPTASLWQVVRDQRPRHLAASSHLIHNDFSASNVLFVDGRLSAVLDWEDAARGHPAYDVSFCRLSTALTLGVEVGDLVLAAYEAEVGRRLENLDWWDIVAAARLQPDISTWTASANYLGSPDLTIQEVIRRFDRFVQMALAGRSGQEMREALHEEHSYGSLERGTER
jgi:aminoglycoside phosphotransferase (APT) family kinase protein